MNIILFLITVTFGLFTQSVLAQQQTIKLGVVNIDAGPLAVNAAAIQDGATFAVEVLNAGGGVLGRRYELATQGHEGTPAAAVAAAQKLVEQQGVSFFTSLSPSGNSLALSAKLRDLNAIYLDATAASDDLTGKACNSNYFRIGIPDSSQVLVWKELAQRNNVKTFDLLMSDIAAARDASKQFIAALPSFGGTLQKELYTPLSTSDYGGNISHLQARPAEALIMYLPGSAGINLAKQQAPFGMFGKYKLVMSSSMVNEILISGQGESTVGTWSSQSYLASFPGKANADFVAAFEKRFNKKPAYLAADAYLSFMLLHEAIRKAGSTDVPAVRKALEGLKFSTIVGEVQMRAGDHQLIRPMVVVQAVKTAPGKAEVIIKSVEPAEKVMPAVSSECRMGG
jgi:branched-chain amino acid transport system substrate-binding protein